MYDGTAETFEALKRPNTAQVIAVVGDKILIQAEEQPDRPHPFTSIPGGRCEENEEPLEAAKRELLEETGYSSSDWTLWQEWTPPGRVIWTAYTYIARRCVFVQPAELDAGERIVPKLVSFDEFLCLSDDPRFYAMEVVEALLRLRLDEGARESFKRLLFG